MIQNVIVAVIVVFAALYVARKYLPATWRQKLVYKLRRNGAENGAGNSARVAQWLNTQSSCDSGCDTCGSCATSSETSSDAPAAPTEHVIKIVRNKN
jgi:hypothetical protein